MDGGAGRQTKSTSLLISLLINLPELKPPLEFPFVRKYVLLEATFSWIFCDLPLNHSYVSTSSPCICGITTLSGRTQPTASCWESPVSWEWIHYLGSTNHTHPCQTCSQKPVCIETAGAESMPAKEAGVTFGFYRWQWQWLCLQPNVKSGDIPSQQYGWRWQCPGQAVMALLRLVGRERLLTLQLLSQNFFWAPRYP